MPRTDILDYYVSLRRADPGGTRTALLAGPFATHTEALANVDRAKDDTVCVDPRTFWDAHGTCSLPRNDANPIGKLNAQLAITPRSL